MLQRTLNHVLRSLTVFNHAVRTTKVMVRKFPDHPPSKLWMGGIRPELPGRFDIWEEDETVSDVSNDIIKVLLTADVPGLGQRGDTVEVHRDRYWRYLAILNYACLPTPDKVLEMQEEQFDKSRRVVVGEDFLYFTRLENILLHIPMNSQVDWTLQAVHVKAAFRLMGYVVNMDCIRLPDEPITRETKDVFHVWVKIKNVAEAKVKAKLFFYEKLDEKRIQMPDLDAGMSVKVTDWRTSMAAN